MHRALSQLTPCAVIPSGGWRCSKGWGREEGQLQTGETCMLQEFGVLGFGIPLKWIPRWRTKAEPSYLVGMGQ